MDAQTFEEHHGFNPDRIPGMISLPYFRSYHQGRFELGLNNFYVFEKREHAIEILGGKPRPAPPNGARRACPP